MSGVIQRHLITYVREQDHGPSPSICLQSKCSGPAGTNATCVQADLALQWAINQAWPKKVLATKNQLSTAARVCKVQE